MRFSVLTIFPELLHVFGQYGIVARAVKQGIVSIQVLNIRDFAEGRHRVTDDRPYGGGSGMVMKPEPLAAAIREAKAETPAARTILLTPQGKPFCHRMARGYVDAPGFILLCGRYEGVDERISEDLIDEEVSVGDYVISGGELAAMIVIDAVVRLIPGVLGNRESAAGDTFCDGRLSHAQFTRPAVFEGRAVPAALLSGDHQRIAEWRFVSSMMRTVLKRPDLLTGKHLSDKEIQVLKQWRESIDAIIKARHTPGLDPLPGSR